MPLFQFRNHWLRIWFDHGQFLVVFAIEFLHALQIMS